MSPQPKQEFVVETTWIREYAKTYLPSEAGFSYSAEHLRKMGLNLIAISRSGMSFVKGMSSTRISWTVRVRSGLWKATTTKALSIG